MIEGMDQDKWITISKIAVPWKTCAAMAAEVGRASVLTGILDLVLAIIHCGKRKPVHCRNHKVLMRMKDWQGD